MAKILLIEPDAQLLEEINIHLGKVGYKMHTTDNGATGVQKALQYKPDLILCDAKPSGLSGDEVFNIIKQVNTTSVIPFVFITTKKSYEELRAVMNLGVDDFLVKPFTMDDIEKLIQIRIEKQRALVKKVNENFQTLVDYVNTAFCVYQEEKFEYVNRKFCEILGYSKSEIIGMNLVNLLYKDDIPKVVDKLTRIFKNI
ncbi:MAG: response regulator, partial [Bacteroidales bacterium]